MPIDRGESRRRRAPARGARAQLGLTWPGGVELSFGQWQKIALARGFMRESPLLLVLDEPTAADRCRNRTRPVRAVRGSGPRRLRSQAHCRRPHHASGLAPVQHRSHGRFHRGSRRLASGGIRHAREPDDQGGTIRGALHDSSGGLSLHVRVPTPNSGFTSRPRRGKITSSGAGWRRPAALRTGLRLAAD